MRNLFAWRTNPEGSKVEIRLGFAGHEKMTMETLPALWQRYSRHWMLQMPSL